jgi:hypothetical protein
MQLLYNAGIVRRLGVSFEVRLVDEIRDWLHALRRTDRETLRLVSAAIDLLCDQGPSLGRPLVDTMRGSQLANLKELRPGSTGSSEIRILFVFDIGRRAVLLIAGDKAGNWTDWYNQAIPIAEQRYRRYVEEELGSPSGRRERKGRR